MRMVGVEAGGRSSRPGDHAARFLGQGGAAPHPPGTPRSLRGSESRSARSPLPDAGAASHPPEQTGAGVGVLQGTRTYLLQDEAGNVLPTHSVSAGLDYPAVGPEHALLHDEGRVRYESVRDDEALAGFHLLAEIEGILPALESSHALGWLLREAAVAAGQTVLVNSQRPRRQGPRHPGATS